VSSGISSETAGSGTMGIGSSPIISLNRLSMADPVYPADSLAQFGGIPRELEIDYTVRNLEVQAGSPRIGGEKHLAVEIIGEFIDKGRGKPLVYLDLFVVEKFLIRWASSKMIMSGLYREKSVLSRSTAS
jgi:hypothetical protein